VSISSGLRARWRAWLAVLAAVGLLSIAIVLTLSGHGGGSTAAARTAPTTLPDRLREELVPRTIALLQDSTPAEHVSHGHDLGGADRILCTVDPFGTDPADASTMGEVRWVYAQHLCAFGPPGTPWDYATKSSGPIAISLTSPTVILLPHVGTPYREQVDRMIPARYLPQAYGTFAHPQQVADLRKKFITEVSDAPTIAPSPSS
jgi:hypothetical protein